MSKVHESPPTNLVIRFATRTKRRDVLWFRHHRSLRASYRRPPACRALPAVRRISYSRMPHSVAGILAAEHRGTMIPCRPEQCRRCCRNSANRIFPMRQYASSQCLPWRQQFRHGASLLGPAYNPVHAKTLGYRPAADGAGLVPSAGQLSTTGSRLMAGQGKSIVALIACSTRSINSGEKRPIVRMMSRWSTVSICSPLTVESCSNPVSLPSGVVTSMKT